VLLYMLGGVITYATAYNQLVDTIFIAYMGSSIVSDEDESFVRYNRRPIAFAVAVLWIFFMAFKIWKQLGRTIYDAYIVKDNEEDRIAAWVV
jgi:uncharacterized membrane protein YdjX (TVP38/TMEM64 family)